MTGWRIPAQGSGFLWFVLAVGWPIGLLLAVGLWNASLTSSEKGFYAMSFVLSLFAVVAIQKNVRDVALLQDGSGGP